MVDLVDFQGENVWLGLNDGKNEGTYVKDNTKNPVICIDWWDQSSAGMANLGEARAGARLPRAN